MAGAPTNNDNPNTDNTPMLQQHTLDQLRGLRLDGMVAALTDTATQRAAEALPFDQRLALLVQRELDWRDGRRVARLLKAACPRRSNFDPGFCERVATGRFEPGLAPASNLAAG